MHGQPWPHQLVAIGQRAAEASMTHPAGEPMLAGTEIGIATGTDTGRDRHFFFSYACHEP